MTTLKYVQDVVPALQSFWSNAARGKQQCILIQPYDCEVGAATFHPASFFGALGNKPKRIAFPQPSRRPADGRYGNNPNRLQKYVQFQVILKPAPHNSQSLYIQSLRDALGLQHKQHDIRFIQDDWESPTLGAAGVGWEVQCDGMEISQFTYFQQVASIECDPVCVELTYGIERLAMFLFNCDNVYDLPYGPNVSYGDLHKRDEMEFSAWNFQHAETSVLKQHFHDAEKACRNLTAQKLPLPAYDQCLKASHLFNLMDARGVVSPVARPQWIKRVRDLAGICAETWLNSSAPS